MPSLSGSPPGIAKPCLRPERKDSLCLPDALYEIRLSLAGNHRKASLIVLKPFEGRFHVAIMPVSHLASNARSSAFLLAPSQPWTRIVMDTGEDILLYKAKGRIGNVSLAQMRQDPSTLG